MLGFLYAIPAELLLVGLLAIAIALAVAGQSFVHRRFKEGDFVDHNEVGGIIIAVAGTVYAVILGFLTVETWDHYRDASELVVQEADADIDAWHTSVGLPPAARQRVRTDMASYATLMIEREWPLMRTGKFDMDAAMIGMDAIDATGGFVPANAGEANAQISTLQQLTVLHDARQRRIGVNDSGLSWFEWIVLLIGAVTIICFCWLFRIKHTRTQHLMTATVVTMIVSVLVLLFELQYPFRSNTAIRPTAWAGALEHIREMKTAPMPDMRM